MKHYSSYMDRQEISQETHEKLLNLESPKGINRPWARYGALAACAALVLGLGVWGLTSSAPGGQTVQNALYPGIKDWYGSGEIPPDSTSLPEDHPLQSDVSQAPTGAADFHGFVVNSPVGNESINFYMMPAIDYQDLTDTGRVAASIAFPEGSFMADLEKEDIQTIFWGPEGKPENTGSDLPWALFWDGYTVHGYAWYNGQGELFQAYIFGQRDQASFELILRPGQLPLTCIVGSNRETSDVFGVEVTGWSQSYDRKGVGQTDYICGSEFMTESGVGVRFESWNNGKPEDGLDGEAWFNTLFVRQALSSDGGLYLDHLAVNENIPAWREEEFATLAQARQEADFAPYLPTEELSGYNEFYGRLIYQEGRANNLFVRWSRGYDNVEVAVYLPGDSYTGSCTPVDISVPASYDTRLYEIPWCDSVPQEYVVDFFSVTFRARDMSLAAVQARETQHDTGGSSFHFKVLHDSGAVVSYSCDGLTAEQVWVLVQETL